MPFSFFLFCSLRAKRQAPHQLAARQGGFTLIEIIVGMVVLSISLSIVSTLIAPTEQKSADQILQVKAAELGQSFLNDISARAFDENSDMAGGRIRCDDTSVGALDCTDAVDFGTEAGEITRDLFDDVDDFNNYELKFNADGQGLHPSYANFTIKVEVIYDGASLGLAARAAKKITVTITTPLDTEIKFASHKANF
ncbi:type II secretion system protein [Colwellia sp. KU-HH00111]|uniref:type II secretion system protein n=1 Tax=Colwellia sp. KU-HH00111 TaxID=3127652 RepID=UPI003109EB22